MRKRLTFLAVALTVALTTGGGLFAQDAAAGALLSSVAPGSPAEKAGIARGDILLAVDEQEVHTPRDVIEAVGARKPGDRVALRISHGDATRTVTVTLDARSGRPYLGVSMASAVAVDGDRDDRGREAPRGGALIVEVTPGSPAALAGLQPRDVVLEVDGTTLDQGHSLTDLVGQHQPGDVVTLSVESRGGQPRHVTVTLTSSPDNGETAYLGVRYGMPSSRPDRERPRKPGALS